MEANKASTTRALLIVTLVLAFVAQYYFAEKREYMWDGLALYVIAGVVFARVIRRVEPAQRASPGLAWQDVWSHVWQGFGRSGGRAAVFGAGALLIAAVAGSAGQRSAGDPEYDLLVLWIVGIGLLVASLMDWHALARSLRGLPAWLGSLGPEAVLVVAIVAGAFAVRVVDLSNIPYIIHGDEGAMGLEAINVMEGRRTSPFVTGWFGNPTLYFFVQAGFLGLFGVNVFGLRFSSTIASTATVAVLYLYARRYHGRWMAILASTYYATFHFAVHYGRLAINNVWDPLFALGMYYLTTRGIESKRLGYLVAAGVVTGLSIYFHAGARLISIILVVYLAYWYWRERERFDARGVAHLVIFAAVALLVALPLLRFFVTHSNDMMAPWTRKALFASSGGAPSRIETMMQTTGKSRSAIMVDQVLKSFLAFNYYHDPTFFYRPAMPLLQFVPAIFFILGFVYALTNWRRREHFVLLLWLALVLIFGSVLLENPPSSHRILLTMPPVTILVVLGLKKVAVYALSLARQPRSVAVAASLVLVLLLGYQSLSFYFGEYTPHNAFSNVNDELANHLGKYLGALGSDYQCYFFGAPRVYHNHPPIRFFGRDVVTVDVLHHLQDAAGGPFPVLVNPEKDAVFAFLPERQGELAVVRRYYPEGLLREFRGAQGSILFVAYEVDL